MGLKDDLIEAKAQGLMAMGVDPEDIDTSAGSSIEVESELTKEAIIKFLEKAEFRVTDFSAPVVLENFRIPDQNVDVEESTLNKTVFPIIKVIGTLATAAGKPELGPALKTEIEKIVKIESLDGATLPGLDLNKDGRSDGSATGGKKSRNTGIVESTGYTFVGDDPDSNKVFNVDDEDGQRLYTTVKFFRGDNEELL